MGLTIAIADSSGNLEKFVADPTNVLRRLLPQTDDRSFCALRHIDPYADTVFNQLQLGDFLDEWARLRPKADTPDARALIDDVESLARECQQGVHRYLKFIGD